MSDMDTLVQKTREGKEWRGTITVEDGDEEMELTVRNLTSPETEEVFRLIDRDELERLDEELPKEKMDERRDLLEMDEEDRTEEEQRRLDELNEELKGEHMKLFDILSSETFDGIRLAAKKGTEPSREDMQEALRERAHEIEEETGRRVETPEDTRDFLNDEINYAIENSTRFVGFQIGMKVLRETGAEEGN